MTTNRLTAQKIRDAAMYVGAHSDDTAALTAAHSLLGIAEDSLDVMLEIVADNGPDFIAQDILEEVFEYRAAVDRLRSALGLETLAAIEERESAARSARSAAAYAASEAEEARDAAKADAEKAAKEAFRTAECDATAAAHGGPVLDGRGVRCAVVFLSPIGDGKMFGLGGWAAGKGAPGRGAVLVTEDGRKITVEAALVAEDGLDVTDTTVVIACQNEEFRLTQPYQRFSSDGIVRWHGGNLTVAEPTATSDWLPANAAVPTPRYDYEALFDSAFRAAEKSRDDQIMLDRLYAMPVEWIEERARLVRAFVLNPDATHGGWNDGKFSVRRDLADALLAGEAAQQAAKAASPFAALAALKTNVS